MPSAAGTIWLKLRRPNPPLGLLIKKRMPSAHDGEKNHVAFFVGDTLDDHAPLDAGSAIRRGTVDLLPRDGEPPISTGCSSTTTKISSSSF